MVFYWSVGHEREQEREREQELERELEREQEHELEREREQERIIRITEGQDSMSAGKAAAKPRDETSLLIPLLALMADGRDHKYIDLEIELRKTLPLSLTIRTEGTLASMADDGLAFEHDWDRYTITQEGITKLAELRADQGRPVVKPKRQAELFA